MAYVTMTKLRDIRGRSNYIGDGRRQEEIVWKSDPPDWAEYAAYEKAHRKSDRPNNEGRELVIALPNEWAELPGPEFLRNLGQVVLAAGIAGRTEMEIAAHWNRARTNLHAHIIFSERTRTESAGAYMRDIYLKDDGTAARTKKDRAKDATGRERPPAHRKGDSKGGFTAKDRRYKTKGWIHAAKMNINAKLGEMGHPQHERQPWELKEYHQGNGPESAAIAEKNARIREINAGMRDRIRPTLDDGGMMDFSKIAAKLINGKIQDEEAKSEYDAAKRRSLERQGIAEPESEKTERAEAKPAEDPITPIGATRQTDGDRDTMFEEYGKRPEPATAAAPMNVPPPAEMKKPMSVRDRLAANERRIEDRDAAADRHDGQRPQSCDFDDLAAKKRWKFKSEDDYQCAKAAHDGGKDLRVGPQSGRLYYLKERNRQIFVTQRAVKETDLER